MKKSFAVWASAVGALALLSVVSCGPDSEQGESGGDGGAGKQWIACEPENDDGFSSLCAEGQRCRLVESVGRSVCVRLCDPDNLCGDHGLVCCVTGNAGTSGQCVPRNDCSPPSTGSDGGEDTHPEPQPDAGTEVDAGTPDAGVDAGTPDAGSPSDGGTGEAYANIRIMAANLTSGRYQSYDEGHGQRLMQGVKPDIVLIQEFNYGNDSDSAIRGFVTETFGANFYYYREGGAQIPNGIISRWPIIESGEWKDTQVNNRDFAWARIDIPGPRDLWAVSVHLLTKSASVRNTEAKNLVNYIKQHVPADDYLVIGGDFNTDSRSEACFGTFSEVVVRNGPHPADHNGKEGTNASRSKPYDNVLVDADLHAWQVPTVIGSSTFPAGLVLDSRVYQPLSEIAPVRSGDSGASNMQHMGVIKDFRVPLN